MNVYCLGTKGMMVFGHDHLGHGESDGKRAYIENVDYYVDDVIQHCMTMQVLSIFTQLAKYYCKLSRMNIQTYLYSSLAIAWVE